MDRPIGVFDSGLGGISTLRELIKYMPNENYIYFGDSQFAPYGTKSKDEVIDRCKFICDFFIHSGVKAIVIACNTATSAAANILRDTYKDIPILGLEPALKVAVDSKNNSNIVVMATPLTLKESKFNTLMDIYSEDNTIIKMPCPELVSIVENNLLEDETLVINQLKKYYSEIDINSIDSVILGCTHFVFYKEYLKSILKPTVNIFDGNLGVTKHLNNILSNTNMLNQSNIPGTVTIYNSSNDVEKIELSNKLLNI